MRKMISTIMALAMIMAMATPIYASHYSDQKLMVVSEQVFDDPTDEGAKLIDQSIKNNGKQTIITKTYQLPDGSILEDVFTFNNNKTKSSEGSDSASRTRTVGKLGSVTLNASFKWYTQGLIAYVTCTSASSSYTKTNSSMIVNTSVTKTDEYVGLGKAYAKVEYSFHNPLTGGIGYTSGSFQITCTDTGSITDNA